MESFYLSSKGIRETAKSKENLERKLSIKIKIENNHVFIEGKPMAEYETSLVFNAIKFGFSVSKALLLKGEDMAFRIIHIRKHTKRKLKDIKARLIGTKGKTRRVMSDISNCEILIRESDVGILGSFKDVENAETAIISLIKGSKQANMYRYLEKMNRRKKEEDGMMNIK
ncbi:hypothetical protein HYV50_03165 [Candidatus Pacearchaeota archaeon]|nr:hypothetical protein [Candidatus Pacearchaeota archaeon]